MKSAAWLVCALFLGLSFGAACKPSAAVQPSEKPKGKKDLSSGFSLNDKRTNILLGGGEPTPDIAATMWNYSKAADGSPGNILYVGWPWPTGDKVQEAATFKAQMNTTNAGTVSVSRTFPNTTEEKDAFKAQLAKADGIYFEGGQQEDMMKYLNENPDIKTLLQEKAATGAMFAGTSAGNNFQANQVINGDPGDSGKRVFSGLGVLPDNMYSDTHYIDEKRKRDENLRGFTAVTESEHKNAVLLGQSTGSLAIVESEKADKSNGTYTQLIGGALVVGPQSTEAEATAAGGRILKPGEQVRLDASGEEGYSPIHTIAKVDGPLPVATGTMRPLTDLGATQVGTIDGKAIYSLDGGFVQQSVSGEGQPTGIPLHFNGYDADGSSIYFTEDYKKAYSFDKTSFEGHEVDPPAVSEFYKDTAESGWGTMQPDKESPPADADNPTNSDNSTDTDTQPPPDIDVSGTGE